MGNLFRKEAVDNYKEQLSIDKQIKKLSFSTGILILIFVLGLLFTAVWFVFGNTVNTVNVTGVVFPSDGIENVNALTPGIVSEIMVDVGDEIKTGDTIAIIPDEDILKSIDEAISNNADKKYIDELRQRYYDSSFIVSKTDGKVLSVCDDESYVREGEVIASIAASKKDENQRQILAFIPTSQKNNISEGCAVQVSPNYAPREKYGYINGYVADIGDSVVTKSDAQMNFNIYNIPNIIDEDETYISVHINLLSDENTESGLNWSKTNSGYIDVETGTVCSSSIVISKQPPYKWLLGGGE